MTTIQSSRWARYGVAVSVTLLALVARFWLDPYLEDRVPYATFFVAVFVAAWYGGLGPALCSLVLGGLLASYFFVWPYRPLLHGEIDRWISLGMFVFTGIAAALLSQSMRVARLRAEAHSQEVVGQRERFRVTLASIGDGVIVCDQAGRVVFLNAVAEQLTGWPLSDAQGQSLPSVFRIVNEDSRNTVENPALRALREGQIVGLANHTVLIARDGIERAIDDSASPIRTQQGRTVGVVLVFRDVSQRRRLEREQRRMAALVESSQDAIVGLDFDGRVKSWNHGAEELYGFTAEETIGRPLSATIVPAAFFEGLRRLLDRVRQGERVESFETVRIRKDGQRIDVSKRISPVENEQGRIVGASTIDRDITARKALERRRAARQATTHILAWAEDIDTAAPKILEAVAQALGWDVACFWTVQADAKVLRCEHLCSRGAIDVEPFEKATRRMQFGPGIGLPGRVWKNHNAVWIADVVDDADFVRTSQVQQAGLHGALACPIAVGDDFLGVVEFFSHEIREPDDDLLEMMATICGQIGLFMERRWVEQQLRRSEAELADFFENAAVGLHWVGPDGRVLRVNQAQLQLLGYSREEVIGRPVADFHVDKPLIEDILRRLESGQEVRDCEARLRCKDGSIRHVLIDSNGLWENGRFIHSRCFTRDITLRREAQREVQRSERLFRAMFEASGTGMVLADPSDGRFLRVNEKFCEITGYPAEELLQRTFLQLTHEDDRQKDWEDYQRMVGGEIPEYTVEKRYVRKDGQVIWIRANCVVTRDPEGQPQYDCAVIQDITQRKEVEEALREASLRKDELLISLRQSEEQFRLLSDTISQLAWLARPDGHIFWYNRRWYEYTGATPEQMDGWGWESVHDPEKLPGVLEKWRAALASGEPWEDTFPLRRHDGQMRWHLSRAIPLKDANGQVVQWCGTNTDITEQRRAEATASFLADASASLAGLLDYRSTLQKVARLAVPGFADWCALDLVEPDGTTQRAAIAHGDPRMIDLANRFYARRPPLPNDPHGVGRVLRTGKSELIREITQQHLQQITADPEYLRALGRLGLKSYICVPLMARSRLVGVLTFATTESGRLYGPEDLSVAEDLAYRASIAIENARLYQEIREADRRKDEFLAMLAHELRNPLAPIRTGLEVLSLEPHTHGETIALMQRHVEHLVRLVDDLLDVSRIIRGRIELRKEPVQVSSIIERSVEAVRPAIDERRQSLAVALPDEPIWLHADPIRMVQVIENLLNNASKYSNAGGAIELAVVRDDRQARITVRDNGVGIEPELLPSVFDLFTQDSRTLDRAQGGLGIGLTLVRRLVEMHGGSVSAQSEGPDRGSTFIVRLPIGTAAALPEPTVRDRASGQSRRVLVVDDNVGAARMLAALIGKLGDHAVDTAHDGPAALAKMDEFVPDLVLLDIGLPGMDGYEVGRRIRQNPSHRERMLVAITGYGQEEDRRRTREAGFDEHLVKPASLDDIENLLDHPKLNG